MVYVMLGTGFEEMEALTPVDLMRRAGIDVMTVGIGGKVVTGGHGIQVTADIELLHMNLRDMDMIVLPGGLGGVASIRKSRGTLYAVRYAWEQEKYVAAICAGPTILADLGITEGRQATCFPGQVGNMKNAQIVENAACVQDGRIITGTSAGTAIPFALKLIEVLKGAEAAQTIANQIVIR